MERVTLLGGRKDICRSRNKFCASGHAAASLYGKYSPGGSRSSTIRPCYDRGTRATRHRSPRHRPVRRGAPNRKVGVYEEMLPTWKSPLTDSGYRGPGVAPEHRGGGGGRRDNRHLSWTQSSGSGPPVHRSLDAFRHTGLTMCTVYMMSRYTMTTRPRAEQREEAARKDLVDLRRRRTQGRLRGAIGGFLPAVSPLPWRTSALRRAFES